MRQLLAVVTISLITVLSAVILGCGERQPTQAFRQSSAASKPVGKAHLREANIPDDVEYSILDSNTLPGIKRSLDVRLNRKVSEETLRSIALKLKSQDSRDYDRTFIGYYLPGMAVGAGAWATTHFDPDLEVRILGLTAEEEEKLVAEVTPVNRDMTGSWLDETPFMGSRITIFREEGRLFMEQLFKDGSSLKKEIIEKKFELGRRFEKFEGSSAGDHWLLKSNGDLEARDNDGLISTAKKIK